MTAQTKIEAGTLSAALVRAFAEIEGATKSAENPHFKSKYADLASVIAAIKPALVNNNLSFEQHMQPSEDGIIVETVVRHASGETTSFGSLYVPANKRDAQGFGSASSYARRYSLLTAFGVPTEDDDGNAAVRSAAPSSSVPANGSGNGHKNDPFPQGPAKNLTSLKDMGRAFWRDVEACGDSDTLEPLLSDKNNIALVNQIMKALPNWWDGGTDKHGETFEGLEQVIARRRRDIEEVENTRSPIDAG